MCHHPGIMLSTSQPLQFHACNRGDGQAASSLPLHTLAMFVRGRLATTQTVNLHRPHACSSPLCYICLVCGTGLQGPLPLTRTPACGKSLGDEETPLCARYARPKVACIYISHGMCGGCKQSH